jgi:hypothetical protein
VADKQDRPVILPKRGGYQGGKPASAMRPPVRLPAAGARVRYTHDEDGTPLTAVALHASGEYLDADDEDDLVFVDGED